ncbi:MAG TPA: DegQ family serine endoprotease, partial [Anaerolineae bacterium]|nr:DegQ family serine endoprotease [Anaerolineae bacterium]
NLLNRGLVLFFVLILVSVLSCADNSQNTGISNLDSIGKKSSSVFLPQPAFAQTTGNSSIADVAEKSVDSVVNIASTKIIRAPKGNYGSPFFDDPFFKYFFGPNFRDEMPQEQRQNSLGSGVIVSEDGIILTNNHVVEDADELKVTLHDNREFDAVIIGTDPPSDLAVIRLKGDIKGLKPMLFGDSDILRLGDVVLAIGSPFGLSETVTMGIVSAKGRSSKEPMRYEDFIQTDAAINPGNSGGALINLRGELVGINTAIASQTGGYQGIGFAIPSNMAQSIMQQLVSGGKVVRGWLGVGIQEVTSDVANAMGLSSPKGVLISNIYENSPADKAGLKSGDIVLRVNGKEMDSVDHLRNEIANIGPDKNVKLTILRNGKENDITVRLGELSTDVRQASVTGEKESTSDGLSVAPLNQSTRTKYNIPDEVNNGVVVIDVEAGSTAQSAGLQPGDVIREMKHKGINQTKVDSVEMFEREYKNAKESILLYIYRNGNHLFVALKK